MSTARTAPSRADKRRNVASPEPLHPRRVLESLRTLFVPEAEAAPAPLVTDPGGNGIERPAQFVCTGEPLAVERTFAFLDLCGFTAFCDQRGEHEAVELLTRFRLLVREVSGRRGVRVAKWLGDGVMLVGTDPGPMIATMAELVSRFDCAGIETHAGLAAGPVLLFEGDDYIGRPVNLAARLCEAAESGELLVVGLAAQRPEWVDVVGRVTVRVAGIGDVTDVYRLGTAPAVAAELAESISAAPAA